MPIFAYILLICVAECHVQQFPGKLGLAENPVANFARYHTNMPWDIRRRSGGFTTDFGVLNFYLDFQSCKGE